MTGFGLTSVELQRHENARKAIKASRHLLRNWTAMARMMARNQKLRVELTSSGTSCTDGETLFIKVPMELAEDLSHDGTCGKRDEDLLPTCYACLVLEDVNITVIHEVSHVIFDTFEDVTAYEKAQLLANAIASEADNNPGSKRAATLKTRIEQAAPEQKRDYLNLSGLVSPFLPFLINACEDIRVNTLMQKERPGTRKMFQAQTNRVFREGVKQYDGTYKKWNEAPPNAQAAIGVYCKVGGFDWQSTVLPEIAEALDDPELDAVCAQMREAKSMRQVYRLAFPLLENLRRLGFMKSPDEPEDEPAPDQPEDSASDDGEPDKSDESDQAESGDDDGEPSPSQDGESTDESGEGDEEQSDGESSDDSGQGEDPGDGGDSDDAESSESEGDSSAEEGEAGRDQGGDSDQAPDEGDGGSADSGGTAPGSVGEGDEDSGSDAGSEDQPSDDNGSDGSPMEDSSPGSQEGQPSAGHDAGGDRRPANGQPDQQEASEIDQSDPAEASDDGSPTGQDPGQDQPGSSGEGAPAPGTGMDDGTPDTADKDTSEKGAEPYTEADQERDGTPEEVEHLFAVFGRHEKQSASPSEALEEQYNEDAIDVSLAQIDFFDSPSLKVHGVEVHRHDTKERRHIAWSGQREIDRMDVKVPENIVSGSLQRLRLAFMDNARGKKESNLRSGKINGRALARRVPVGDDRLFKKSHHPGRKDYFVVIGVDCSGSTSAHCEDGTVRLNLMKSAVLAKAEMLSRLGIPFAVYAHSGSARHVDIFEVKSPTDPWSKNQKTALIDLQPYSANLDGHTLEYYRKVAEKRTETDKLILYYTDGAMPAANFKEELEILQREIKVCKRLGIHLVGIGVNSDSPTEHGLDTILLDSMSDVSKVVKGLQARLAG